MPEPSVNGGKIAKWGELFVGHVIAVILGLILVILGTGMGVSLVLLPVGVPVGLVGLGLLLWGLFGGVTEGAGPGKRSAG
jgi:hypothetical protein